jgi:spermidine/putrescine ABC transporter ATP-binding subunit
MESTASLKPTTTTMYPGPVPTRTGPALEVRNLVKRFGDVAAVDDVSFSVPGGAFMSVLGPSGSGKTTLLRLLTGFEMADAGSVTVGGVEISGWPPYRRDIGVVFQRYALFPHMTVAENVAFGLRQRRVPAAERRERVERVLDMVGLPDHSDRRPSQLSGGQQQRVALARALVFNPRILVMDEPLAALDKHLRERMQQEIRSLQGRLGITTVYVTHDQTEAFAMSDLVAVMNKGRIEQIGVPRALYGSPTTEFVARFVGDSNLFRGGVVHSAASEGEQSLRLGDGTTIRCRLSGGGCDVQTVLVRPERMIIADRAVDGTGKNALPGRIREVIFLGEIMEYVVAAGGQDVFVREQNRPETAPRRPGADVVVSWAVEDTIVL